MRYRNNEHSIKVREYGTNHPIENAGISPNLRGSRKKTVPERF